MRPHPGTLLRVGVPGGEGQTQSRGLSGCPLPSSGASSTQALGAPYSSPAGSSMGVSKGLLRRCSLLLAAGRAVSTCSDWGLCSRSVLTPTGGRTWAPCPHIPRGGKPISPSLPRRGHLCRVLLCSGGGGGSAKSPSRGLGGRRRGRVPERRRATHHAMQSHTLTHSHAHAQDA